MLGISSLPLVWVEPGGRGRELLDLQATAARSGPSSLHCSTVSPVWREVSTEYLEDDLPVGCDVLAGG